MLRERERGSEAERKGERIANQGDDRKMAYFIIF